DVRNAQLVACYSRSKTRSAEFAVKWGPDVTAHPDMDALCADPRVDIVVIALPNEIHLEATRIAAKHGKAVICTKPLGRTEKEAAEMLKVVLDAGIWHGYAESAVFSPKIAKAYDMVQAGGIGKLLTMRAREGHSGPHAPHFWDAET